MGILTEILGKDGLKTIELNRRQAIRERCLNCSAWYPKEVSTCEFHDCQLYPYRMGKGKQNAKARAKALLSYCRWCMGGHRPSTCVVIHCPLYCYRKGKAEQPVLLENDQIEGCFDERDALRVAEAGLVGNA
jgi:hypothetical protein